MGKLRMVSLFAGIEGIGLAAERTGGFEVVLQCETDKYAQQVLNYHYPHMPLIKDVKDVTVDAIQRKSIGRIDVLTGGFPCQDVSMAGRRQGLAGERSGLWFEYHRLIQELRPRWVVIENVPGLLSSNDGRDFAVILRGLVECGYCVAYRVLDAQYFVVPQRRRRVFIVGCLGSGRAAEVLFERKSSAGNFEPGGNEGQEDSGNIGAGASESSRIRQVVIPYRKLADDWYEAGTIGSTLKTTSRKNDVSDLIVRAVDVRNLTFQPDGISGTLQAKSNGGYSLNYQNPVAIFQQNGSMEVRLMQGNGQVFGAIKASESKSIQTNLVTDYRAIRRLTPLECERLQGFPDGWTAIDGMSDTQRYKMLGNAVAVPVVNWIMGRLLMAEHRRRMEFGEKPILLELPEVVKSA